MNKGSKGFDRGTRLLQALRCKEGEAERMAEARERVLERLGAFKVMVRRNVEPIRVITLVKKLLEIVAIVTTRGRNKGILEFVTRNHTSRTIFHEIVKIAKKSYPWLFDSSIGGDAPKTISLLSSSPDER